jgi:hypothetical protein
MAQLFWSGKVRSQKPISLPPKVKGEVIVKNQVHRKLLTFICAASHSFER